MLFQPAAFGAGAADAVAVGAVLSMLIPDFATEALTFPALSVQVPVPDVWSSLHSSPSSRRYSYQALIGAVAEKLTVTSVLFQPYVFAAGNAFATAVGAVRSILIPVTVVDAEFPAASVQVPPAD